MANSYHNPVMLAECMEMLDVNPEGIFVDLTFGGGGHTSEMLRRGARHVYAFDQDADAEKNAENIKQENLTFVRSNFRYLTNWLHYYGVTHVDGILADLGVSSHQFDDLSRGFSFRGDAPVDMRMNQRQPKSANDILNLYTEEKLADTFYLYGELKQARRIASAIVKARTPDKVWTTGELSDIVNPYIGRDREKKDLARLFQALRIEVNGEMDALREMLCQTVDLLSPGGRLVVMTYHSLEDRMVKNFMRSGNIEGHIEKDFYGNVVGAPGIASKTVTASAEEIDSNPRSRSAKLRQLIVK